MTTEQPAKIDPPTTTVAMLVPAGLTIRPRFTRHVYVRSRPLANDPLTYEHVYRCTETGEERVWGVDGSRANQHGPSAR